MGRNLEIPIHSQMIYAYNGWSAKMEKYIKGKAYNYQSKMGSVHALHQFNYSKQMIAECLH